MKKILHDVGALGAAALFAVVLAAPAQTLAAPNPAVVPQERLAEGWWGERHRQVLEQVKAHPETKLLLIGDSITNNYDKDNPPDEVFHPTWTIFYEPRGALNLGFSGDTTAHVLWRLDHGEVEGIRPKAVVLLIGTNNTGYKEQTAEQTEAGIDAVVADLRERLPKTKILLLGILPSDVSERKTAADRAVNRYLADRYGADRKVTFLDIGPVFYRDGMLDTSVFYDQRLPQHGKPLHPDGNGQRRMAEAIEPTLARLMRDQPRGVRQQP